MHLEPRTYTPETTMRATNPHAPLHYTPTMGDDDTSAALWELCNATPHHGGDDAPDMTDATQEFMLQIDVSFM